MKFEVLSRQNAKKMSYKQDIDDCVIISITDVNSAYNNFANNPHIKGVCHIKFDDVDNDVIVDEIGADATNDKRLKIKRVRDLISYSFLSL